MNQIEELSNILFELNSSEKINKLLNEILTPNEIKDVSSRLELLKKLKNGETQRTIASDLGISLCKITRGSKILKNKNSMLYEILYKTEVK